MGEDRRARICARHLARYWPEERCPTEAWAESFRGMGSSEAARLIAWARLPEPPPSPAALALLAREVWREVGREGLRQARAALAAARP